MMADVNKLIASLLAVFAVAACAPEKTVPMPTFAMAAKSGDDLAVLQKGHAVYMANCTRCHEPMMPSEVSKEDWHIVTPGMAWNAGISVEDEEAVMKYILAAR
jgi:cytochrome c5